MAERRSVQDADPDTETESDDTGTGTRTGGKAGQRRLRAGKAAEAGLQQITELTGKEPEGVSGVEPSDDGWRVTVEVVEDHRIPSSTDLLATYLIELDPAGELLSYRRVRRYTRGRGDSDGDYGDR